MLLPFNAVTGVFGGTSGYDRHEWCRFVFERNICVTTRWLGAALGRLGSTMGKG
jgi:hypothetical protein